MLDFLFVPITLDNWLLVLLPTLGAGIGAMVGLWVFRNS